MSEMQLVLQLLSEMDKRFTEKFEQLEERFDLLERRFENLEAKVDKLDVKITMVHDQVVRNSEAIDQCVTKNDLKNIVNLLT